MPSNQIPANPELRPIGPLKEADKQLLIDAFALGDGVRDAARRTGLSQNQVTTGKKRWGLTSRPLDPKFSPDASGANEAYASKARRERHARRERWQKITDKIMSDLERDLFASDTKATVRTILKGAMGVENEELVISIPARDLRERLAAANLGEIQIQKIDALDDDGGLSHAQSTMEKILETAMAVLAGSAVRPGLIQE